MIFFGSSDFWHDVHDGNLYGSGTVSRKELRIL